jgi:hypothetical protein
MARALYSAVYATAVMAGWAAGLGILLWRAYEIVQRQIAAIKAFLASNRLGVL